MGRLKINILSILIIVILITVFVMGFTYVRFLVLLILTCMLFVELVRKKLSSLAIAALLVCLYFSMMPSRFPFVFQQLERIRFGILQGLYANEVENVLADYPDNMDYQFIEGCNWILTSHGKADYQREGDCAIIFFITDYTEVSGYVYYSDDTALEWIKDCARIEEIKDHWVMVQMYD